MKELGIKAQQVYTSLVASGFPDADVVELPTSARTAQMAADALGCTISQIAKSLVFQGKTSKRLYLVVASGSNRVESLFLDKVVGEPVKLADPILVEKETGFAVGGIPPVGHTTKLSTYIDKDLLDYDEIWAAAGEPETVFKLTPEILQKITTGTVIPIHF